ncbi:hypothetical protein AABB24_021992, partial [Solanum stoloniferum]
QKTKKIIFSNISIFTYLKIRQITYRNFTMSRSSTSISLVVILIISSLSLSNSSSLKPVHSLEANEVKCRDITRHMKSCIDWTKSGYKNNKVPPKACCNQIFKLNTMGKDSQAEVAICECVKAGLQDPNINAKAAESLTWGCQVLLAYPTTPKVNCSEITAPNTKF